MCQRWSAALELNAVLPVPIPGCEGGGLNKMRAALNPYSPKLLAFRFAKAAAILDVVMAHRGEVGCDNDFVFEARVIIHAHWSSVYIHTRNSCGPTPSFAPP